MQAREVVKILERKYKYIIPSALIKIDDIEVNEQTIQKDIDQLRLLSVEWLIANEGQADPIYVTWNGEKWTLLYGLEELEVFKKRGIEMIEAKILEGDMKRIYSIVMRILESRKNLNPIELAEALEELKEETGFLWKDIAELTGMSVRHIQNVRLIKNCPYEDIKQLVREGKISIRNALKEIRLRRKQERGDVVETNDVIEDWQEQPYTCPICQTTTVKGATKRVCEHCCYILTKVLEIMKEKGITDVEEVANYLVDLILTRKKEEEMSYYEIHEEEEFSIREEINEDDFYA